MIRVDFFNLAHCTVNKGDIVLFRKDLWRSNIIKNLYPQLYSVAKKLNYSFTFFLEQPINTLFSFPISPQSFDQLSELMSLLENMSRDEHANHSWRYIWGSSVFTPKEAYQMLRGVQQASPLFKCL